MKELIDEKFDVDELVEKLLSEEPTIPKKREVRLNLGLMGKSTITVDGKTIPLPSGINKLTAGAVKELAGKYQGLILARENQNRKAVTLDNEDVVDVRKEDAFHTQKPVPTFRTLPRLGLD